MHAIDVEPTGGPRFAELEAVISLAPRHFRLMLGSGSDVLAWKEVSQWRDG